jgi:hypothetical protein
MFAAVRRKKKLLGCDGLIFPILKANCKKIDDAPQVNIAFAQPILIRLHIEIQKPLVQMRHASNSPECPIATKNSDG